MTASLRSDATGRSGVTYQRFRQDDPDLGRPARRFADLARDHAAAFRALA